MVVIATKRTKMNIPRASMASGKAHMLKELMSIKAKRPS
jgi:hypothetical protein